MKQSENFILTLTGENGGPMASGHAAAAKSWTAELAPSSSPAPGSVSISATYGCILAVQDQRATLVPIFTGRDLLFALKEIWQRQN